MTISKPKLRLEAPQVVFTPSSFCNFFINSRTCLLKLIAPTGITSGSIIHPFWNSKIHCSLNFFTSNLILISSDIPESSLEIPITAQPNFFTKGRTVSKRSSSPVTELSRALPHKLRDHVLELQSDNQCQRNISDTLN